MSIFLKMSAEDAAKVIISAGMVVPDYQARLKQLADQSKTETSAHPAAACTPPGFTTSPCQMNMSSRQHSLAACERSEGERMNKARARLPYIPPIMMGGGAHPQPALRISNR